MFTTSLHKTIWFAVRSINSSQSTILGLKREMTHVCAYLPEKKILPTCHLPDTCLGYILLDQVLWVPIPNESNRYHVILCYIILSSSGQHCHVGGQRTLRVPITKPAPFFLNQYPKPALFFRISNQTCPFS